MTFKPGTMTIDPSSMPQRLDEINSQLFSLYGEYATVSDAQLRAKDSAYWSAAENSHNARDAAARHAALDFTSDLINIESQIKQLEEERDHLRFLIKQVYDFNREVEV